MADMLIDRDRPLTTPTPRQTFTIPQHPGIITVETRLLLRTLGSATRKSKRITYQLSIGIIGVILGLYGDNGKENGNYYSDIAAKVVAGFFCSNSKHQSYDPPSLSYITSLSPDHQP